MPVNGISNMENCLAYVLVHYIPGDRWLLECEREQFMQHTDKNHNEILIFYGILKKSCKKLQLLHNLFIICTSQQHVKHIFLTMAAAAAAAAAVVVVGGGGGNQNYKWIIHKWTIKLGVKVTMIHLQVI
jgi:hypothetical protein